MSKTLLVPDHYVDKKPKEPPKTKQKIGVLEEAYVRAEDRFLDPSKITDTAMSRLPEPTGWRVLLLPYQGKKQTDGGILLPTEVREKEALGTVCGYVLKVGPLAYLDADKFGENSEPWCKKGDWVIFGRYAGSRFKIEGGEVRLLNDDEILARITDPDDILHY